MRKSQAGIRKSQVHKGTDRQHKKNHHPQYMHTYIAHIPFHIHIYIYTYMLR